MGALKNPAHETELLVSIPANGIKLEGSLVIPARARGIVLFAHGSGSSRHSARNNFVAEVLHKAAIGTLLMDLLTKEEDSIYENRFDIDLLTWRPRNPISRGSDFLGGWATGKPGAEVWMSKIIQRRRRSAPSVNARRRPKTHRARATEPTD